jgi:hypothetical protein
MSVLHVRAGIRGGRPSSAPLRDLGLGERFGRLTVTCQLDGRQVYRCRCDCGKDLDVPRSKLLNRERQSCGCLTRELRANAGRRLNAARSRETQALPSATPPCRSGAGCDKPAEPGQRFCARHGAELARIREKFERGGRRGVRVTASVGDLADEPEAAGTDHFDVQRFAGLCRFLIVRPEFGSKLLPDLERAIKCASSGGLRVGINDQDRREQLGGGR